MNKIFKSIRELQQDVVRNIVKILSYTEVFSDLSDNTLEAATIAEKTITDVLKQNNVDWQFHFTAAIGYPFETDHWMASRYSDGTFPIWYGSLDRNTTIHETAYHMFKSEMSLVNIQHTEKIIRKRIIYDVLCRAILIDLTSEKKSLGADEYSVTQAIGKQIYEQGYPGLLATSVRYIKGTNIVIMNPTTLSHPRVNCELTYQMLPGAKKIEVIHQDTLINTLNFQ